MSHVFVSLRQLVLNGSLVLLDGRATPRHPDAMMGAELCLGSG